MRVLITGGNGQLGRSLRRSLDDHHTTALGRGELDITQPVSVATAFAKYRPQLVIHTAALVDTARCELDPAAARAINGLGAEQIARACQQGAARLIAISTNEVFDGNKSSPYCEDDVASPINAYGISKLEAERLAMAACVDTLVVRTSWVYGSGGTNFVTKVTGAAAGGHTLSFVADEIATPTFADDLAAGIRALIGCEALPGIYHLTNADEASRYDWAAEILRLARSDVPIKSVATAELRAAGYAGPRKPAYSVLANRRAAALGVTMRSWQEALTAYFARRE